MEGDLKTLFHRFHITNCKDKKMNWYLFLYVIMQTPNIYMMTTDELTRAVEKNYKQTSLSSRSRPKQRKVNAQDDKTKEKEEKGPTLSEEEEYDGEEYDEEEYDNDDYQYPQQYESEDVLFIEDETQDEKINPTSASRVLESISIKYDPNMKQLTIKYQDEQRIITNVPTFIKEILTRITKNKNTFCSLKSYSPKTDKNSISQQLYPSMNAFLVNIGLNLSFWHMMDYDTSIIGASSFQHMMKLRHMNEQCTKLSKALDQSEHSQQRWLVMVRNLLHYYRQHSKTDGRHSNAIAHLQRHLNAINILKNVLAPEHFQNINPSPFIRVVSDSLTRLPNTSDLRGIPEARLCGISHSLALLYNIDHIRAKSNS
jgi:hypothetical protein